MPLSGLQNTTAYRWYVHPKDNLHGDIEHGASENRAEASAQAKAAYFKHLCDPAYTADNLKVTLFGPRGRWILSYKRSYGIAKVLRWVAN